MSAALGFPPSVRYFSTTGSLFSRTATRKSCSSTVSGTVSGSGWVFLQTEDFLSFLLFLSCRMLNRSSTVSSFSLPLLSVFRAATLTSSEAPPPSGSSRSDRRSSCFSWLTAASYSPPWKSPASLPSDLLPVTSSSTLSSPIVMKLGGSGDTFKIGRAHV